ncbi:MAG: hypothetical protein IPM29_24455 [Planctomycetes bacterium]|nr:hypothetical protein [Planctomycetota bacterium]
MNFSYRHLALLPVFLAAGPQLAAQQPFGAWVHDNAANSLSLYVAPAPLGSNSNSGDSPSRPLATLDRAVAVADRLLSNTFPTTGTGVTINVLPGAYTLAAPLSVPCFGIAIESYRCTSIGGATAGLSGVTVQLASSFPNNGVIEFDRQLGPASVARRLDPLRLPPSVLRGIEIVNNSVGFGIVIDPTINAATILNRNAVTAVEINQCRIEGMRRGLRIVNILGLPVPYANVIADNEIVACGMGLEIDSFSFQSDLLRSNRIHGGSEGIVLRSQTLVAGDMHARVLSNAVWDMADQFGIRMDNCSATIVNNTVAFVRGPVASAASVRYGGSGAGETLIIANNILFSPAPVPGAVNPLELDIVPGGFAGTLTVVNNDFDATSPAAPFAGSPTNIAIATPAFANMTAPFDVHLTPASPALVNPGDQGFVLPGSQTTITVGGRTFGSNCALDMDLDARTSVPAGGTTVALHRGADQLIGDGIRLTAPTASPTALPHQLADVIGTVVPAPAGNSEVLLDVTGSANDFAFVELCSTMPMGAELQHVGFPGIGSLGLDPSSSSTFVVLSGPLPLQTVVNLGTIVPTFLEAEMYLQALVLRQNGTFGISNRIRIELDKN